MMQQSQRKRVVHAVVDDLLADLVEREALRLRVSRSDIVRMKLSESFAHVSEAAS
jgi:hypothetical protein